MIDRKTRALTEKLYLLQIDNTESEFSKTFSVVESTGNVYEVNFTNKSSCNCPDFLMNHKICKHLYFIFFRILKQHGDIEIFSEKKLKEIFSNINTDSRFIADNELRNAYIKKIKNESKNEENNFGIKKQIKDNNCPICIEELKENETLDYCKFGCGKSIHKECFNIWSRKREANEKRCVYCRTEWERGGDKKKKKNKKYFRRIGYNRMMGYNKYFFTDENDFSEDDDSDNDEGEDEYLNVYDIVEEKENGTTNNNTNINNINNFSNDNTITNNINNFSNDKFDINYIENSNKNNINSEKKIENSNFSKTKSSSIHLY